MAKIYTYVDRRGFTRDLSDMTAHMPKDAVAQLARQKDRIHRLASSVDYLKAGGYSSAEVRDIFEWILSGRALAGIGG